MFSIKTNKKLLLALLLALTYVLVPERGLAAGEAYLANDSIKYAEGSETYHNIIATSDGGYAATLSVGTDGFLHKYNADGTRAFSYQFKVKTDIWYSSFGAPLAQAADGGYALASMGGEQIKLDATGREIWKKQITGGEDIYGISVSSFGNMLLRISEKGNAALSNQIWCVDAAGQVKWKKNRDDYGVSSKYATFSAQATTTDGNFVATIHDEEKNIIIKLDNNGGLIWRTTVDSKITDPSHRICYDGMAPTSDGGLVVVGRDENNKALIAKFDSNGKHQWSNASYFSYYKTDLLGSVIETDWGYLAVGMSKSFDLMSGEVYMPFSDALIVRYDKSGNVIEGTVFIEGFDTLKSIIAVGDRFYALGMAMSDHYNLADKPTGLMIFSNTATQQKTGWEQRGDKWFYRKNGLTQRGWLSVNEKWYWLKANGAMVTGWVQEAQKQRFFMKDNGQMATGWLKHMDAWYYFRPNGSMATGWYKDNGLWYYFKTNGAMATGWLYDFGDWYYLKSSGAMATGWLFDGGNWYYLNPGGTMVTGWLNEGGEWYHLKPGGDMATGWLYDGGNWYYFKPGGAMATGWLNEGGKWYYLKPRGTMAIGVHNIDGRVSVFGADGVWRGYR